MIIDLSKLTDMLLIINVVIAGFLCGFIWGLYLTLKIYVKSLNDKSEN